MLQCSVFLFRWNRQKKNQLMTALLLTHRIFFSRQSEKEINAMHNFCSGISSFYFTGSELFWICIKTIWFYMKMLSFGGIMKFLVWLQTKYQKNCKSNRRSKNIVWLRWTPANIFQIAYLIWHRFDIKHKLCKEKRFNFHFHFRRVKKNTLTVVVVVVAAWWWFRWQTE